MCECLKCDDVSGLAWHLGSHGLYLVLVLDGVMVMMVSDGL